MKKIALNADVGEGMNTDNVIMPYLTYANIACGGHIGNKKSIHNTLLLAKKNQVLVGAHPSYPDIKNFGRKSLSINRTQLSESLKNQIDLFLNTCTTLGIKMNHIKLHGALYNDVFNSYEFTNWFLKWVNQNYGEVIVFIPIKARENISNNFKNYIIEAFADRNYCDDLTLVSRNKKNAIIPTAEKVKTHVRHIINGSIKDEQNNLHTIVAQTICVHGDHPRVLDIIKTLYTL